MGVVSPGGNYVGGETIISFAVWKKVLLLFEMSFSGLQSMDNSCYS